MSKSKRKLRMRGTSRVDLALNNYGSAHAKEEHRRKRLRKVKRIEMRKRRMAAMA